MEDSIARSYQKHMSKKKKSSDTIGKMPRVKINIKKEVKLHFQNSPNESFSFSELVKHLRIRDGKSKDFVKKFCLKWKPKINCVVDLTVDG